MEVADDELPVFLMVYTDDFDISDSSSSSSTNTKVTACYTAISNLKYEQQSKRDDIFLSIVALRSQFDIMKKEKYFKPLIDSINDLNSNPIRLSNGLKIKLILNTFIGDNSASNEVMGISRGFGRGTYSCKWCVVGYDDLQKKEIRYVFNEREEPSDNILKECEHTKTIFTPDIFHDINFGKF